MGHGLWSGLAEASPAPTNLFLNVDDFLIDPLTAPFAVQQFE